MQQQQKRRQRGLGVLAAKRDHRTARLGRVVIDLADDVALPVLQLDPLADVWTFRQAAVFFDPGNIRVAARQGFLYSSHGIGPMAALRAAVAAFSGVYRDWLVSRSLVASPAVARVSISRICSSDL